MRRQSDREHQRTLQSLGYTELDTGIETADPEEHE
jgi:hypothetical protein